MGGIGALLTLTGIISTIITIIRAGNPASADWELLGVGSILGVLTFVGFVLFLISMYGFSKDYGEQKIFRYILYGFVGAIILAVVITTVWSAFTLLGVLSNLSSYTSLPTDSYQIQTLLAPYISPLVPFMSVVTLVWIYFNYKSYNLLAEKSKVNLFRSAAKIFVLGVIVNLAVGSVFAVLVYNGSTGYSTLLISSAPGAFIQYFAWALMAKGFFAIKAPAIQATQPYTYTGTTSQAAKYCSTCGTQNQADASYCAGCGQKL